MMFGKIGLLEFAIIGLFALFLLRDHLALFERLARDVRRTKANPVIFDRPTRLDSFWPLIAFTLVSIASMIAAYAFFALRWN